MNEYQEIVYNFFKNIDGKPFILTKGQSEIFKAIYEPDFIRVAIRATTQFGKSDVASMAIITSVISRKEKVLIIAPSDKQANIIMRYVIDHLFDKPFITRMIEGEGGSLDRLKEEKSKRRITFKGGSEIFTLTASASNLRKQATNLMGFGATQLICLSYNEKILTNQGYKKIGEIVEKKQKVKIVSYNHSKRQLEYKDIEKYEKHKGRKLIEIMIGKKKIICTEDHLVYIRAKGYVKAKDIVTGDKVWVLD